MGSISRNWKDDDAKGQYSKCANCIFSSFLKNLIKVYTVNFRFLKKKKDWEMSIWNLSADRRSLITTRMPSLLSFFTNYTPDEYKSAWASGKAEFSIHWVGVGVWVNKVESWCRLPPKDTDSHGLLSPQKILPCI